MEYSCTGPYHLILKNVDNFSLETEEPYFPYISHITADVHNSEVTVLHANDLCVNNYLNMAVYRIKKVIYNPPATVIIWADGTKTVAKCDKDDIYDKQTGFLIAYFKKLFGNEVAKQLRKWVWESEDNPNVQDHTDEFEFECRF